MGRSRDAQCLIRRSVFGELEGRLSQRQEDEEGTGGGTYRGRGGQHRVEPDGGCLVHGLEGTARRGGRGRCERRTASITMWHRTASIAMRWCGEGQEAKALPWEEEERGILGGRPDKVEGSEAGLERRPE